MVNAFGAISAPARAIANQSGMAGTMAKTLDALKLNIRERVEVRLATGGRWSVADALRRRAQRRRQEAFYAAFALSGGVALAAAFALTTGWI